MAALFTWCRTSFSSAEFSEAFAAPLRLPSPASRSRVGEPVPGRVRLDCWGDSLVNAAMRGDGWRKRHDGVKLCIRGLLHWAGLDFDCEVFNLFAHNILRQGLREEGDAKGLSSRQGSREERKSCPAAAAAAAAREKGAAGLPSLLD